MTYRGTEECVRQLSAAPVPSGSPGLMCVVFPGCSPPARGFVARRPGSCVPVVAERATETRESWVPAPTRRPTGRSSDWTCWGRTVGHRHPARPPLACSCSWRLSAAQMLFDRVLDGLPVLVGRFGSSPVARSISALQPGSGVTGYPHRRTAPAVARRGSGTTPASLARQTGSIVAAVGLLLGALALTAAGVTRRVAPTQPVEASAGLPPCASDRFFRRPPRTDR